MAPPAAGGTGAAFAPAAGEQTASAGAEMPAAPQAGAFAPPATLHAPRATHAAPAGLAGAPPAAPGDPAAAAAAFAAAQQFFGMMQQGMNAAAFSAPHQLAFPPGVEMLHRAASGSVAPLGSDPLDRSNSRGPSSNQGSGDISSATYNRKDKRYAIIQRSSNTEPHPRPTPRRAKATTRSTRRMTRDWITSRRRRAVLVRLPARSSIASR